MGRMPKFSNQQLWEETHNLLLEKGYEAFKISDLAERLSISRAAIYKQYANKEQLLFAFMIKCMDYSISQLNEIDQNRPFLHQLDTLMHKIYDMKEVHQVLSISAIIPVKDDIVATKKQQLQSMHEQMYTPLMYIVNQGKLEGYIDETLSNVMVLAFIFQTIDIPNMGKLDNVTFFATMKRFILKGIQK